MTSSPSHTQSGNTTVPIQNTDMYQLTTLLSNDGKITLNRDTLATIVKEWGPEWSRAIQEAKETQRKVMALAVSTGCEMSEVTDDEEACNIIASATFRMMDLANVKKTAKNAPPYDGPPRTESKKVVPLHEIVRPLPGLLAEMAKARTAYKKWANPLRDCDDASLRNMAHAFDYLDRSFKVVLETISQELITLNEGCAPASRMITQRS
jgi:hypothetical protein